MVSRQPVQIGHRGLVSIVIHERPRRSRRPRNASRRPFARSSTRALRWARCRPWRRWNECHRRQPMAIVLSTVSRRTTGERLERRACKAPSMARRGYAERPVMPPTECLGECPLSRRGRSTVFKRRVPSPRTSHGSSARYGSCSTPDSRPRSRATLCRSRRCRTPSRSLCGRPGRTGPMTHSTRTRSQQRRKAPRGRPPPCLRHLILPARPPTRVHADLELAPKSVR